MSPKDAVSLAKTYVTDLFSPDGAMNIGLEELRFDVDTGRWIVTIGFSRAWEGPQGSSRWVERDGEPWPRTYKTVEIDDLAGVVVDLRHRSLAA